MEKELFVDANLLIRVVAGSLFYEEGSRESLSADVNGDGKVNSMDANLIKRVVSGSN